MSTYTNKFRHANPGIRALLTFTYRLAGQDDDTGSDLLLQTELDMYKLHVDTGFTFGPKKVHVDLSQRQWTDHGYLFSFGAYGTTHVYVCADSLEDGLEQAAEQAAPGQFHVPEYSAELDSEGVPVNAEEAESDLTYTEAGWLPSWEWSVTEMGIDELIAFVRNESVEYD